MLYRLHTGRAYEVIGRLVTEGGSKIGSPRRGHVIGSRSSTHDMLRSACCQRCRRRLMIRFSSAPGTRTAKWRQPRVRRVPEKSRSSRRRLRSHRIDRHRQRDVHGPAAERGAPQRCERGQGRDLPVFPLDSDTVRTPQVPTRVNSPSDVELADRDSLSGNLSFTPGVINSSFTAAN
jgi:hypothetical protein